MLRRGKTRPNEMASRGGCSLPLAASRSLSLFADAGAAEQGVEAREFSTGGIPPLVYALELGLKKGAAESQVTEVLPAVVEPSGSVGSFWVEPGVAPTAQVAVDERPERVNTR